MNRHGKDIYLLYSVKRLAKKTRLFDCRNVQDRDSGHVA